MQHQQYYTPEIEDLFVGYELEWKLNKVDWITYGDKSVYGWEKHTMTQFDFATGELGDDFHNVGNTMCEFRTPYLTKEQIEKEGWTNKNHALDAGNWAFEKGNRFAVIRFNDLKNPLILEVIVKDPSIEPIVFGFPSENFRFSCPCPSINEFRKICKWLGI